MQDSHNDVKKSPAYLGNSEKTEKMSSAEIIRRLLSQNYISDFIAQITKLDSYEMESIPQNPKIEAMAKSYKTDVINKPKYRTLVKIGNQILVKVQVNENRFGIEFEKSPFYLDGAEDTKTIISMQLLIRGEHTDEIIAEITSLSVRKVLRIKKYLVDTGVLNEEGKLIK